MKCEYCGGEVGSLSEKCPYCGRENKSFGEFKAQVEQKEKRNKELPRIVLKLYEKEIASSLITRINLGLLISAIIVLVFSFGVYCVGENKKEAKLLAGSQADRCLEELGLTDGYYQYYQYVSFVEASYNIVDRTEKKEEVKDYTVEQLIESAYGFMRQIRVGDVTENYEEKVLFIKAFFKGYLHFTSDELTFLVFEGEERPLYYMEEEDIERIKTLVYQKLKGGL